MKRTFLFLLIVLLPVSGRALTLQEAVAVGLQKNLELSAAKMDRSAARAEASGQMRDFFPKILGEGRYMDLTDQGSMEIPQGAYNMGVPMTPIPAYDVVTYLNDKTMHDFSFTLAQPILGLYKINKAWRLKKKIAAIAGADVGILKHKVAMDVIEAFCRVKMVEKKIDLAKTNIKELNAHLARIESLHRVGHVLDRDLFQVRLGLDNARLELEIADRERLLAVEKLFWVMGGPVEPSVFSEPVIDVPMDVGADNIDATRFVKSGLENRWEMKKAVEAVKAGGLQVGLAVSDYLPELNVFARYTEQEGDNSLPDKNTFVGLEVTATLFEWGKTGKRKAAAGMRLDSARKNLENAKEMIRLDVLLALKTFKDSRSRHRLADQSLRLAQESLRITQKQYEAGRATITDLLNDQTVFHQARTDLTLVAYQMIIDYAAVRAAAGMAPLPDMNMNESRYTGDT